MPKAAKLGDALTDCYQAVSHIIDQYGTVSPHEDTCTYQAGELLLVRTRARTLVKYQGREVMRVPVSEGGAIIWRPGRSWLDVIDRLYEDLEPGILCHTGC